MEMEKQTERLLSPAIDDKMFVVISANGFVIYILSD